MMNEDKIKTVCEKNKCTGCMACIGKCAKNAIAVKDDISAYNAVIDESKCISCGACERVCPNNYPIERKKPIEWCQGWAETDIRKNSSSGGAASAMIKKFIENGGYVASCMFEKGEFIFDVTKDVKRARRFAGSKYVKSDPAGIYKKIMDKLKAGERVLFIGLPCQVAGLKKYVGALQEHKNLYTVDLVCHGTPSPKLLTMFLKESNIDIHELKDIAFRKKTNFGLDAADKSGFKDIVPKGVHDMYTHAFLTSLDYTENCYSCAYADISRVSDVTLGDAWGSELSKTERDKGISIVLCQTEKGRQLIKGAGLVFKEADLEKEVSANHQLSHPSIAPKERAMFFKYIDRGFNKAISKCMPKFYYKQKLKALLVGLGVIKNVKGGGGEYVIRYIR